MLVSIEDDFDLEKICNSGQCFRYEKVNGFYRFVTGNKVLYIKHYAQETYDVSCSQFEWDIIWVPYFDLNRKYSTLRSMCKQDSFLYQATESGIGIRILRQDAWEMLITFIISQRKTIPAIKKSVEALCRLFGTKTKTKYEDFYLFPTVFQMKDADDNQLSECGLGYRVEYIKSAISLVLNGAVDLHKFSTLNNSDLLCGLKQIKGVGDKVANCVMLFAYGRLACVPVDTWIKKVIDEKYNGIEPFSSYGDAAGVIQQYVFHYIQQHKQEV